MTTGNTHFPAGVLTPVELDDFFDRYWEAEPLHIGRSCDNHFSSLLSLAEIESALSTHHLSFPAVQLTQADQALPVSEYTQADNKIVVSRLLQCHQRGATLIISQAQYYFPALADLVRQVQTRLQLRCQTNVYLSPPGKQGFYPHFDSHDVFILQVSGKKTFRFYSGGVDLPFNENSFDSEHSDIGVVTEEIELQSGDTLYIPRGVVHDAQADDSESSLHITLGVYAVTLRSVLQEIVQLAAESDLSYRKSFDHRLWRQQQSPSRASAERIKNCLASAFSEDNLAQALARIRDDIALDTRESCNGLLSIAPAVVGINQAVQLNSMIKVHAGAIVGTERINQQLLVRVNGRVLHFEGEMIEPVEWLLKANCVKVSDLENLDDEQKVALTVRLLQENIVQVVDSQLT